MYGTIDKLDDAHSSTATESLAILNEVVRTVDKAAQQQGSEKTRTLGRGTSRP